MEGQVVQPVQPVQPPPFAPGWPYDWWAKVDRDFEFHEATGLERDWGHHWRKIATDYDYREAHDQRTTTGHEQELYYRGVQDRRAAESLDHRTTLDSERLKFEAALWASYLENKEPYRAINVAILNDTIEGARMARAYGWDLDAERKNTRDMLKESLDANVQAFREFQRGGVVPFETAGPKTEATK